MRGCATIYTSGCTSPAQPNQTITIIYQDASGQPLFKTVTTDAAGCFNDEHVVVEGGEYTTTAMYPGDGCYSSASDSAKVNVGILVTGDTDDDGVPNPDEPQGDDDGDGIVGMFDPDSDNDGILDGDEPKGNSDCDSYDNIIDADSDNDGIVDGQDSSPYGNIPKYRLMISGMFHRFNFDSDLPIDDGNGFNIRIGYNLSPHWGIEGEFGNTSTKHVDKSSGKVINLNANALYFFTDKSFKPYLTAGAGTLLFNGFSTTANTFALNGGIGFMALQPSFAPSFALRAEAKAHYGFGGYGTDGNLNIQYSIGIVYRVKTKSTPCNVQRVIKSHR